MRAPTKVKYVSHPAYGNFELPKYKSTTNIKELYNNYAAKEEKAKYLNPFGLRPTITSRFRKPITQIDFVSHEMLLTRSPKPYDEKNKVSFRCAPHLSKPEIKQYLSKIYELPVNSVDTVNKMGKMKKNNEGKRWRKQNWKKAICTLDYEVDNDFRHF